ncbi:hypothetical protein WJX73_006680 [Symbiochloris irregularis]|uniref:Mitochondrial fission 1 protein n=1 Tax=Symbiochloris irregularis TaxID=706552 RepID=A0AAW1P127_9CHLO
MELPLSDDKLVADCRKEFETAQSKGHTDSAEASIRYCWALVHSPNQDRVWQGLAFAEALLGGPGMTEHNNKEVIYLSSVAKYKLGKHVDARRQVQELLKVSPGMRQAQNLNDLLEATLAKEALIGVGIGAGLLGVAALVVAGLARR